MTASGSVPSQQRQFIPRQFRLRREELEALAARAEQDATSRSEVVRRALRRYLGLK